MKSKSEATKDGKKRKFGAGEGGVDRQGQTKKRKQNEDGGRKGGDDGEAGMKKKLQIKQGESLWHFNQCV